MKKIAIWLLGLLLSLLLPMGTALAATALEPASAPDSLAQEPADSSQVKLLAAYSGLSMPTSLLLDGKERLLISSSGSNNLKAISEAGVVSLFAGSQQGKAGLKDGALKEALFNQPRGLVFNSQHSLFVADSGNNAIRKIRDGQVLTVAGKREGGSQDGYFSQASFNHPCGIAVDGADNLYVADTLNHTIRKIDPAGNVTTLAGQPGKAGYADGPQAVALFNEPCGLALQEKAGQVSLFIADSGNQRIRQWTEGLVTTLAGSGEMLEGESGYYVGGYQDGPALSAAFNAPKDLILLGENSLAVADSGNQVLRGITMEQGASRVNTLVGNGHLGSKLGQPQATELYGPAGLALGEKGLYLSEMWNSRVLLLTNPDKGYDGSQPLSAQQLVKILDFDSPTAGLQVWVQQNKLSFGEVQPRKLGDKIYVPLRTMMDAVAGSTTQIAWDAARQQVLLQLPEGNLVYPVDGEKVLLEQGRTLIEVQQLAADLGWTVAWVPEYQALVMG